MVSISWIIYNYHLAHSSIRFDFSHRVPHHQRLTPSGCRGSRENLSLPHWPPNPHLKGEHKASWEVSTSAADGELTGVKWTTCFCECKLWQWSKRQRFFYRELWEKGQDWVTCKSFLKKRQMSLSSEWHNIKKLNFVRELLLVRKWNFTPKVLFNTLSRSLQPSTLKVPCGPVSYPPKPS